MITKAKWQTRSTFDCSSGRLKGPPFDVDGFLMEGITEYAASNDCEVVIRNDVRADNSERRLTVVLEVVD